MEDYTKELIKTGLLEGKSVASIAKEIGEKTVDVRSAIRGMGMDWAVADNRSLSKGHSALTELFRELIPNYEIINEHYIGDKLHLDIYCPRLKIAAEFHGRQHFEFNKHFHTSKYDFEQGQRNDELKADKCRELGIALIVFCYNDDMSLESVTSKIVDAIASVEGVEAPAKKSSLSSDSDYYKLMKERRNAHNREVYKKMKQGKKRD
jgi:hypothetical protein